MKALGSPGLGAAQKEKLAELFTEMRRFNPSVSVDDLDEQYAFALTVRDLVVRLRTLATAILQFDTEVQLQSIVADVYDLASES